MNPEVRDHIIKVFESNKDETWKTIVTDLQISSDDYEIIKNGRECTMAEDRWAMAYFKNEFYIVRFTGIPVYQLHLEAFEKGARITSVKFNSNKAQVNFTSESAVLKSLRSVLRDFSKIELKSR
jgi:hypothetical protein